MRTLSKFGLAGVRLGYLAGPAALIDEIDKVRPPYNISALNAEATLFALEHADEFARQAALLRGERERLQKALRDDCPASTPFPSEANMILVRVPDARGRLRGHEARAACWSRTSPACIRCSPNCLRLTVGTPEENAPHDRRPARQPAMNAPLDSRPPRRAPRRRCSATPRKRRSASASTSTARGAAKLATGIGFFDHMLDQIARHGLIDLEIEAQGDLHIDGHHTVEDVGITLGQAVGQAVGDKRGLRATATPTCRSTRRCRASSSTSRAVRAWS